jgi:hypothetical protein
MRREISEEIFMDKQAERAEGSRKKSFPTRKQQNFPSSRIHSASPEPQNVPLHPLASLFLQFMPPTNHPEKKSERERHESEANEPSHNYSVLALGQGQLLYNFDGFASAIKIIIIKVCFLHETVRYYFLCDFYCLLYDPRLLCV